MDLLRADELPTGFTYPGAFLRAVGRGLTDLGWLRQAVEDMILLDELEEWDGSPTIHFTHATEEPMTDHAESLVKSNLLYVLAEMSAQANLSGECGGDHLSFREEMDQIHEFIHHAREYAVAYECLVVNAEEVAFNLSSRAAVKLLEVGLLMGFKTTRECDAGFVSSSRSNPVVDL